MTVTTVNNDSQELTWIFDDVDSACNSPSAGDGVSNGCGIHIHVGTGCADHSTWGGHFFNVTSDPWGNITYVASGDGSSTQKDEVQVATGLSEEEILGRVMVVHELTSGARIACGVIEESTGDAGKSYVDDFVPYPGYTGNLTVTGQLTMTQVAGTGTTAKQMLSWNLEGVDTACVGNAAENVTNGCGIHVHAGTSCDVAANVGGHYFSGELDSNDPWLPIKYVSDPGAQSEGTSVEVITGLSMGDITGRVVVVHELAGGARVACGIVKPGEPDTPFVGSGFRAGTILGHIIVAFGATRWLQ